MGVFKVVENCERTRRGDFEDGAETKSSSSRCHTIEVAVIGLHQAAVGSFPIRAVEVVKNSQHTCWRHLKYDPEAVGPTLGGCSIKIAVGTLNYRANRPCSVGFVELVDECDFTGRRHFEHRAAAAAVGSGIMGQAVDRDAMLTPIVGQAHGQLADAAPAGPRPAYPAGGRERGYCLACEHYRDWRGTGGSHSDIRTNLWRTLESCGNSCRRN